MAACIPLIRERSSCGDTHASCMRVPLLLLGGLTSAAQAGSSMRVNSGGRHTGLQLRCPPITATRQACPRFGRVKRRQIHAARGYLLSHLRAQLAGRFPFSLKPGQKVTSRGDFSSIGMRFVLSKPPECLSCPATQMQDWPAISREEVVGRRMHHILQIYVLYEFVPVLSSCPDLLSNL